MQDIISRQAAIDAVHDEFDGCLVWDESGETTANEIENILSNIPSAQPEYEPVKAEDFARTMSKYTIYSFIAWHGEALGLMKDHGFMICKKTM